MSGIIHGRRVSASNELARGVVALVTEGARGQSLCSGSILDDETILTAAHCVDHDPRHLIIVFGTEVANSSVANQRAADVVAQNPQWDHGVGAADLALVHFTGGLPGGFAPITLAPAGFRLPLKAELRLIGFGVSNALHHDGAGSMRQTRGVVESFPGADAILMESDRSGACFGDSGGPAFVAAADGYVQIGVAHAVLNAACNSASIYIKIDLYRRWIEATAERLHQATYARR